MPFWTKIAVLVAMPVIVASTLPLQAGPLDEESQFGRFGRYADKMELRLGALAYDRGAFSTDEFDGVVINGEFLFRSPEFLSGLGAPRPYIGFDAAIADDPIHFAYGGVSWDMALTRRIYVSGSVGGAITTAEELHEADKYKSLGSKVLFHLGVGVGFDISEKVTLQLYADHFSNAKLAEPDNGAEATGARIGFRF